MKPYEFSAQHTEFGSRWNFSVATENVLQGDPAIRRVGYALSYTSEDSHKTAIVTLTPGLDRDGLRTRLEAQGLKVRVDEKGDFILNRLTHSLGIYTEVDASVTWAILRNSGLIAEPTYQAILRVDAKYHERAREPQMSRLARIEMEIRIIDPCLGVDSFAREIT